MPFIYSTKSFHLYFHDCLIAGKAVNASILQNLYILVLTTKYHVNGNTILDYKENHPLNSNNHMATEL